MRNTQHTLGFADSIPKDARYQVSVCDVETDPHDGYFVWDVQGIRSPEYFPYSIQGKAAATQRAHALNSGKVTHFPNYHTHTCGARPRDMGQYSHDERAVTCPCCIKLAVIAAVLDAAKGSV
jgi:hypothetical protein